jgi:FkbM family methyltransferase
VPAAKLARLVGAREAARKISVMCGYVPRVVEVLVPDHLADHGRFLMHGAGGHDGVARTLWWSVSRFDYERPLPDLFASCSRSARLILDVGAFSGFYSMIAATCAPEARVFAFESMPIARGLLEANLRLNRMSDRVCVVPRAVGEHRGEAVLNLPVSQTQLIETAGSLNSSLYDQTLDHVVVPVTTLDEFLAEREAGPVDLMKMDVETFEPQVLRGSPRLLTEHRPIIFLEILPAADSATLEEIRNGVDYVFGRLVPAGVHWERSVRHHPDGNDYVLCPREKRDQFHEAIRAARLQIVE